MALDGWTKVDDRVAGTGRWVLYRHKGTLNATVEAFHEWPAGELERAFRFYDKRAAAIRRGGLWLVDPPGVVRAVTFIRP